MKARQGTDPKRRIVPAHELNAEEREALASRLIYVGSALHKTKPGDYGFHPPVNPRPWKSICDGLRVIVLAEARELFRQGILGGMFSKFPAGGAPKYVWTVDDAGEVYEAKVGNNGYHGYRLEEDDAMRKLVLREWAKRCLTT
jgi:hypothetical protein